MKNIRAILFDLIGTTVLERDPALISSCFDAAFTEHGITVQQSRIQQIRGMDKKEAIDIILSEERHSSKLKTQIFDSFKKNVQANLENFVEHPALTRIVRELHNRKILIAVASGLPSDLFQALHRRLGWASYAFAYTNVYENCSKGRPHPEMIFTMCTYLGIDPENVLKVGDTIADIEEGKNAGAFTAAVSIGTQPRATLRRANPDFLLDSLEDVVNVLD